MRDCVVTLSTSSKVHVIGAGTISISSRCSINFLVCLTWNVTIHVFITVVDSII